MKNPNQSDHIEPFFITEDVEKEMITEGGAFAVPLFVCTGRQLDVLKQMTDAELSLQQGEIADLERERRQGRNCQVNDGLLPG